MQKQKGNANLHNKKINLTIAIYLALILGILFGILIKYAIPQSDFVDDFIINGVLYVFGQGFIRLMKMLVVPLVFCSIVCGSMAIGDTKKLGRVGVKTICFYLATTCFAVTLALSVASIISPGVGLNGASMSEEANGTSSDELEKLKAELDAKALVLEECEKNSKQTAFEAIENAKKLTDSAEGASDLEGESLDVRLAYEAEEKAREEYEEAQKAYDEKSAEAESEAGKTKFSEVVLDILPENPVNSLAEGKMLQIILFALFVGVLIAVRGEKARAVADFFSQFNDLMMDMTMAVMKVAPVGIFCLISKTFANIGLEAFLPMLKYMFAVILALFIQCFGIYQILLFLFTRLNPIKFLKKFFPVMSFAFSTATSNATIPLSIDTLTKKLGVSKNISSFTIPLGATINMDGTSIMQGVAVVFVAQAFGIDLSLSDYITVIATATLASIGTAGIPSVGLVTLAMVFDSVGLPVEGIAIIMGIDRILDMMRTAVNITGDAVCTTIVAYQDKALDKKVFNDMKFK